jgi:hypothetical protein
MGILRYGYKPDVPTMGYHTSKKAVAGYNIFIYWSMGILGYGNRA